MNWKQRLLELFGVGVKYDASFFGEDWFQNWNDLKFILKDLIAFDENWQQMFDFGCGPGVMIDLMNEAGYHYVGFDTSEEAHDLYAKRFGGHPEKYVQNLKDLKDSEWDLCVSFDVLEHMKDEQVIDVFSDLMNVRELLLNISRQKGIPGHINLKEDYEWVALFAQIGFEFDMKKTQALRERYLSLKPDGPDHWHRNMFLFARTLDD